MVVKLRRRDYEGAYIWLRRYEEVIGRIHIGGVVGRNRWGIRESMGVALPN